MLARVGLVAIDEERVGCRRGRGSEAGGAIAADSVDGAVGLALGAPIAWEVAAGGAPAGGRVRLSPPGHSLRKLY